MLIKALVAWMRGQNCSRDERGIQTEEVADVGVESSLEVVMKPAGRLRSGGCSFGVGGGREALREQEKVARREWHSV